MQVLKGEHRLRVMWVLLLHILLWVLLLLQRCLLALLPLLHILCPLHVLLRSRPRLLCLLLVALQLPLGHNITARLMRCQLLCRCSRCRWLGLGRIEAVEQQAVKLRAGE